MSCIVKGPSGKRIGVFHFPKTAGTWLRRGLMSVSGVSVRLSQVKSGYSRHCAMLAYDEEPPEISFTTVRAPDEWIMSWWRYQMPLHPKHEPNSVHPCHWSDDVVSILGDEWMDFSSYVRGVIKHGADGFNRMYRNGTKSIDRVWRMDSLEGMVAEILEEAGAKASAVSRVMETAPDNVSRKIPAEFASGLKTSFRKAVQPSWTIYNKALK